MMSILETKYNFAEIQNMVDAARHLQDSGQNIHCEEILKPLAEDLLKS